MDQYLIPPEIKIEEAISEDDKNSFNELKALYLQSKQLFKIKSKEEKNDKAHDLHSLLPKVQGLCLKYRELLPYYFDISNTATKCYSNRKEHLETFCTKYFEDHYSDLVTVEYKKKTRGVQGGAKAVVIRPNETFNVYIKTHQICSGRFKSGENATEPKELFLYKLLSLIEVGPEVDFVLDKISRQFVYFNNRSSIS